MAYTVKQLSSLSGVSIRTLHYYDEIGLLKPAYTRDNGYRYYEKAELLLLQQILFYRELGFSLNEIQRILSSEDFDRLAALESHRNTLEQELDKYKQLIETVNKTIAHLKGEEEVNLEEIFEGFTEEKQAIYENFLVESGVDQQVIDECRAKTRTWPKQKWLENKNAMDQLHDDLVVAIENGEAPDSSSVQALIQKHYDLTCELWTPNRSSYAGLADLYGSHEDFVKFYAAMHPQLLTFLQQAMKVFAEKNL